MKFSHALLCAAVTLSLAGVAVVSCRRIPPPPTKPEPTSQSQPVSRPVTTSRPAPKFIWYTIKRGDTADKVAKRLLVGGKDGDITKNNPEITNWRNLSVGTKVRVPIKKYKDKSNLPTDFDDPIYAPDPPKDESPPPEEVLKHPY